MSVSGRDRVLVCVRVRPQSRTETVKGHRSVVGVNTETNEIILDQMSAQKRFPFDYVAGPDTSQREIFEVMGKPLTSQCFQGYNGTLLAYGQTGSGKTFTILGGVNEQGEENFEDRGICPRALQHLFGLLESQPSNSDGKPNFLCKCTMIEIYNENIKDLFDPSSGLLRLREDQKLGVHIEGVSEKVITTWEEAYIFLKKGSRSRTVGRTDMNENSSRSHCVFTIDTKFRVMKNNVESWRYTKLHIVDLAGSERQKSTGATGSRLREASNINNSLSVLGSVIRTLSMSGAKQFIRYRDSKLTFLLKDSLGGNSKTSIVATVSPIDASMSETFSTLTFATRAKSIRNKALLNEDASGSVADLQAEIKRLKMQLCQLSLSPQFAPSSPVDPDQITRLETTIASQLEREAELVDQLSKQDEILKQLLAVQNATDSSLERSKALIKIKDARIDLLSCGGTSDTSLTVMQKEISLLKEMAANPPEVAFLRTENEKLQAKLQAFYDLEAGSSREEMEHGLDDNNVSTSESRVSQLESELQILQEENSSLNTALQTIIAQNMGDSVRNEGPGKPSLASTSTAMEALKEKYEKMIEEIQFSAQKEIETLKVELSAEKTHSSNLSCLLNSRQGTQKPEKHANTSRSNTSLNLEECLAELDFRDAKIQQLEAELKLKELAAEESHLYAEHMRQGMNKLVSSPRKPVHHSSMDSSVQSLQRQKEKLEDDVGRLQEQIYQKDSEIRDLQDELMDHLDDLESLRQQSQYYQAQTEILTATKGEHMELENRLEYAQAKLTQYNMQLSSASEEIEILQKMLLEAGIEPPLFSLPAPEPETLLSPDQERSNTSTSQETGLISPSYEELSQTEDIAQYSSSTVNENEKYSFSSAQNNDSEHEDTHCGGKLNFEEDV
ncbi:kinesin family member 15 [Pelomyxa schiedti]|nr:kinesin family member 15 [Pelomyxa schiedti]